ncbi:hypothetical protein [Okeania hirsuta]|nr:hypothetical protein [Okeania hirsuta]NET20903.1 hypothetical protein [Okeania sp. SIO1H5]
MEVGLVYPFENCFKVKKIIFPSKLSEGSYHQDLLEAWLKDSLIYQLE